MSVVPGLVAAALCVGGLVRGQPVDLNAWRARLIEAAEATQRQAEALIDDLVGRDAPMAVLRGTYLLEPGSSPLDWTPIGEAEDVPERLVLLVHGLDEPGDIWDDLAPVLDGAGWAVARFDYPNDQAIADSGDSFVAALADLKRQGVGRVSIVAHSMGGLIARDALTRDPIGERSEVERLILVGTPNHGSSWAKLRGVAEFRELVLRWLEEGSGDPRRLWTTLDDGAGEAGRDLLPGSDYLRGLNDRPLPDVPITNIVGTVTQVHEDLSWLRTNPVLVRLFGRAELETLASSIEAAWDELGDGVVTVESATLEGVEDVVRINDASHRGMIRRFEAEESVRRALDRGASAAPKAIPVILDRLGEAFPASGVGKGDQPR